MFTHNQQDAEKVVFSRMLKNAPACAGASAGRQMHVEGKDEGAVATNKERLVARPRVCERAGRRRDE
jgi:hypothetical protein